MYFRVFDKKGNEITNEHSWVITSEGEIRYLSYGDLIGMNGVSATFYFDNGFLKTIFNNEEEEEEEI